MTVAVSNETQQSKCHMQSKDAKNDSWKILQRKRSVWCTTMTIEAFGNVIMSREKGSWNFLSSTRAVWITKEPHSGCQVLVLSNQGTTNKLDCFRLPLHTKFDLKG